MAWNEEEKDFLIRLYKDSSNKDLSIALNKKENTIRVMAKRLGLTKKNHIEANKKKCAKCEFIYPANTEHFPIDKSKTDNLHNYCKECHRNYRLKKKIGNKKCNKCELIKSKLEFQVRKNNRDGLDTICRECRSIKQREYYIKNQTKIEKRKIEHIRKHGW